MVRHLRHGERLGARLGDGQTTPVSAGEVWLELPSGRGALLYVPLDAITSRPAPLAVMLHGAGARGDQMRFTFAFAETYGCVLLVPDAAGVTWDVIQDSFGPDVAAIDAALAATSARVRIDPTRVALGGFSDGASYALSLGVANGHLFTHVMAFSPGFVTGRPSETRPRIFISHGRHDEVLPIARTSRLLVPRLKAAGYDVTYHEFDGPHSVPDPVTGQAFSWWLP